jgi:glycosyltransferase involved in cell wall biosynthesis
MARQKITIIVPVYNEEAGIEALIAELREVLASQDFDWGVLFIDDGSTDRTLGILRDLHGRDPRFTAISFSRNFGKETAIAAGFRYAHGDAVILMDGDLQHPPAMIPDFVASWRAGNKVVFGQRASRDADSALRRLSSRLFHAVFRRIAHTRLPVGIVDFLLLDRAAVDAINRLGERSRFSKGLFAWIGFSSAVVPFDSPDRGEGVSRWSFLELANFGMDGLISFSSLPLKIWSYVGAAISLATLVYIATFPIGWILFGSSAVFPTLIVSLILFAGIQLITLGIIGEYLARIYEEVKGRPLFVVAEEIGVTGEVSSATIVSKTGSAG